MITKSNLTLRLAVLAGLLLLITGCVMSGRTRAHGTSVIQFLYPREPEHIDTTAVPVLPLPLRVGIAFVPPGNSPRGLTASAQIGFSESAKTELLRRVADEFRGLAYVKSIELIPTTYLRPGGGFENLDQVKAMFGLDVIALVAYDQVQFTDEGLASLAYWTIVGAYVVQGEKNDTQTLMEAVVYDLGSRRLLFRAPGTSRVQAHATPINLQEELRRDGQRGFDAATTEMIANLKVELTTFRERVKQAPDDYKIVHRPGYTGAGRVEGWLGGALMLAVIYIGGRKR